MAQAFITGSAGFIGHHLALRLLRDGWQVTGIDCFTDYYDRETKERNASGPLAHEGFDLIEADEGRLK